MFTRDDDDKKILVKGVKVVLDWAWEFLMVDFVVPILADNPLAYCPVLISLYLVLKKTSEETQQGF